MICLFEQFGYKEEHKCTGLDPTDQRLLEKELQNRKIGSYVKTVIRKGEPCCCYKIDYNGSDDYRLMTSYFVGVDWVIENQLALHVCPKENENDIEIDYINMLLRALAEPENLSHLDGLCTIEFGKPYIPVSQKQDLLSPFLIAQYISVLKHIVHKGLKKSYYTKTENLKGKVKGKILISQNIKRNIAKGKSTDAVCSFQEFGYDTVENRLLKKALVFSRHALGTFSGLDASPLGHALDYISPAFKNISDEISINDIKHLSRHPIYKEYEEAVKLAKTILERYSYNITNTERTLVKTPPFWIDMSKLFELYVYKKLREIFPAPNEVVYHKTFRKKEIDFLINSPDKNIKMVADAKYKPRYHDRSVELQDIRQISAYARMENVYKEFQIDDDRLIDCLIIYSNQECEEDISVSALNAAENKLCSYRNFYKTGIRLPKIE